MSNAAIIIEQLDILNDTIFILSENVNATLELVDGVNSIELEPNSPVDVAYDKLNDQIEKNSSRLDYAEQFNKH